MSARVAASRRRPAVVIAAVVLGLGAFGGVTGAALGAVGAASSSIGRPGGPGFEHGHGHRGWDDRNGTNPAGGPAGPPTGGSGPNTGGLPQRPP